jgi:hypothetical protein
MAILALVFAAAPQRSEDLSATTRRRVDRSISHDEFSPVLGLAERQARVL